MFYKSRLQTIDHAPSRGWIFFLGGEGGNALVGRNFTKRGLDSVGLAFWARAYLS